MSTLELNLGRKDLALNAMALAFLSLGNSQTANAWPDIPAQPYGSVVSPQPVSATQSSTISGVNQLNIIPLTNVLPPEFQRMLPSGATPTTSDYIPDVMKATKGRVLRFNKMPVKVYITPYPEPGFTETCIKGFDDWENRSSGLIAFLRVDNPEEARVRVVWKRLGNKGAADNCLLGAQTITRWKANNPQPVGAVRVSGIPMPIYIPRLGPKYSVEPQIIEVNLDLVYARDPEIRLRLLKNIVTHELGHSLGLLGHSQSRSDLMFAETDETSRLSQRDINTLTRLYQMKVDIPL